MKTTECYVVMYGVGEPISVYLDKEWAYKVAKTMTKRQKWYGKLLQSFFYVIPTTLNLHDFEGEKLCHTHTVNDVS